VSSTISIVKSLKVEELGVVDYLTAWELQKQLQEKIANNQIENRLLMLQHPSVYTAGRRTELVDRPIDNTPVIDVDRGGKITWHGIGQIVGYPILRLKNSADVVGFVRELETSLIQVCELFGVKADRYGLRVAKGVTTHGFALNVNPDLSAYAKIIPCGIADAQITSLAKELDRSVTVDEVMPTLIKQLTPVLERLSQ